MYHLSIFLTILLTVYGQLVFKWRVELAGEIPASLALKTHYLLKFLFDPWVISTYLAAVVASACWFLALTKFDLSYAYPFMSLTFLLVSVGSTVCFSEPMNANRFIGVIIIMIGLIISSMK